MIVTDAMVARAVRFNMSAPAAATQEQFMRELLDAALTEPVREDGRPTQYTPEIAARVFELLAQGLSLRAISRTSPDMPDPTVFLRWMTVHGLSRQYAHARDSGIDARFEDLNDLAATANADNAAAVRIRVDVEKWALSKLKPGKYGDRLDLNVSGSLDVKTMNDDTLNAKIEGRLRMKLEPVFDAIEHPTLDDILRPFRITSLPLTINHDEPDNG